MARTRLAIRLDPVRATGLTRDTLPGWPAISPAADFRVTNGAASVTGPIRVHGV
jgi:hypothetical protein